MNDTMYKEIAEKLINVLPAGWTDVKLYCQLTKASYEFFFFVNVNGEFIQCFNLDKEYGITKKELREIFKTLNTILKPDYEEKNWFAMTYSLSSAGKFNVDYEYTDYSGKTLEYKEIWKSKYLK